LRRTAQAAPRGTTQCRSSGSSEAAGRPGVRARPPSPARSGRLSLPRSGSSARSRPAPWAAGNRL